VKAAARFRAKRLEVLADLSRAALNVLRLLVDSARADVGPLKALSEALGRRA
jgi:HTH-type transcriptional regulator, glycine betaine synthesis regulator